MSTFPEKWTIVPEEDVCMWPCLARLERKLTTPIRKFYRSEYYFLIFDINDNGFVVSPYPVLRGRSNWYRSPQHDRPPRNVECTELVRVPSLCQMGFKQITGDARFIYFIDRFDIAYYCERKKLKAGNLIPFFTDDLINADHPVPERAFEARILAQDVRPGLLTRTGEVYSCLWDEVSQQFYPQKVPLLKSIVSFDYTGNHYYALDVYGRLHYRRLQGRVREQQFSLSNVTSFVLANGFIYLRTESGRMYYVSETKLCGPFQECNNGHFFPDIYKVFRLLVVAWSPDEDIFHKFNVALDTEDPSWHDARSLASGLSLSEMLALLGEEHTPQLMTLATPTMTFSHFLTPTTMANCGLSSVCTRPSWPVLRLLPKSMLYDIRSFSYHGHSALVITKTAQVYFVCNAGRRSYVHHLKQLDDKEIVEIAFEAENFYATFLSRDGQVYAYVDPEAPLAPVTLHDVNLDNWRQLKRIEFLDSKPGAKVMSIRATLNHTGALTEDRDFYHWNECLRPQLTFAHGMIAEIASSECYIVALTTNRLRVYVYRTDDIESPWRSVCMSSPSLVTSFGCLRDELFVNTIDGDLARANIDMMDDQNDWIIYSLAKHRTNQGIKRVMVTDDNLLWLQNAADDSWRVMGDYWANYHTHPGWRSPADATLEYRSCVHKLSNMTAALFRRPRAPPDDHDHEHDVRLQAGTSTDGTARANRAELIQRNDFFKTFFSDTWQNNGTKQSIAAIADNKTMQLFVAFAQGKTLDGIESVAELLKLAELADYVLEPGMSDTFQHLFVSSLSYEQALPMFEMLVQPGKAYHHSMPIVFETVSAFLFANIVLVRATEHFKKMENAEARRFLEQFNSRRMKGDFAHQAKLLRAFYVKKSPAPSTPMETE